MDRREKCRLLYSTAVWMLRWSSEKETLSVRDNSKWKNTGNIFDQVLDKQFAGVNILETEFLFRRMLKGGLMDQINKTELKKKKYNTKYYTPSDLHRNTSSIFPHIIVLPQGIILSN